MRPLASGMQALSIEVPRYSLLLKKISRVVLCREIYF